MKSIFTNLRKFNRFVICFLIFLIFQLVTINIFSQSCTATIELSSHNRSSGNVDYALTHGYGSIKVGKATTGFTFYRGWMYFYIPSSLRGKNISISQIELNYYVSTSSNDAEYQLVIPRLDVDPRTATDQQLWDDIGKPNSSDVFGLDNLGTGSGWQDTYFDIDGRNDLENTIGNSESYWGLGFYENGENDRRIIINGNDAQYTEPYLVITYTETLNTPTGVTASDGTYCDEVHMDWNDVSGATYYKIYKGSSCGTYLRQVTGSACTIINASGSNTKYCVKACNSCGCSSASSNYGYAKTVPSAPTGVSASDGTYCDKVKITWNSASGATKYDVKKGSTTVCSNTTSTYCYDYSASTSSTTYKVYAKNDCGTSSSYDSDSGYKKDVPSTPTGVTASDGTYCDKVQITWNNVSEATKYKITRDGTPLTESCTSTPYDDNDASPWQTYSYCVYAENDCGWSGSACDNGYKKDVPSTPTGASASDDNSTKVTITWDNVSEATKYKITRDGTPLTESCTSTPYDDNDATPGQTYNYCVYAGNDCGWSGSACDDGIRPVTTYTLNLTKGGDGDGQIKVNSTTHNLSYSETFDSGTSVSLEAISSSGSFTGWSDDLSGSTNPTTITMNDNKNVTVNFNSDTDTYTLYLTKGGDGDGQIKVNSTTHNLSYSETFDSGTSVSLEAISSSDSFTGWDDDLSGSTNPTTITMNGNKNVVVNFINPEEPNITLTPSIYDFGNINVGNCSSTYTFTLKNIGYGTATGSVSLTGSNPTQFEITEGGGNFSLSTDATKPIKVKFCPKSSGNKTSKLLADGSNCDNAEVSINGITGIDDINDNSSIKIYPNPATNTINIVFEDKSYKDIKVDLLNIQGQTISGIKQTTVNSDNLQLDLSNCSTGIYYLNIQTDKGTIVRKISVMK